MAKPVTPQQRGRHERVAAPFDEDLPIVVEPQWLLRAALVVLAAAFLCGYATLCGLFYQGQWQLVLHPVRTAARPATIGGAPSELVRFGPDGSGIPQRTAWWMAAGTDDRYRHLVLLYMPAGDGSLNDAMPLLTTLRQLGVAVFAMEYRGFGESGGGHPSEATMREDAEAAWVYLTLERSVSARDVIPFGTGVGAALALGLAGRHAETAAVVLDAPRFDVVARVKADPRVRFLPVEMLLHDRFALEPALTESRLPKLIVSQGRVESREIAQAGEPKMTVEMPSFDSAEYDQALRRFLDAYAPPTPPVQLMPKGAPPSAK